VVPGLDPFDPVTEDAQVAEEEELGPVARASVFVLAALAVVATELLFLWLILEWLDVVDFV
jgi:hypothetical protein